MLEIRRLASLDSSHQAGVATGQVHSAVMAKLCVTGAKAV